MKTINWYCSNGKIPQTKVKKNLSNNHCLNTFNLKDTKGFIIFLISIVVMICVQKHQGHTRYAKLW